MSHEKAQKNEVLKLEKLSRAEAKVRGLSKVRSAEPIPAGLTVCSNVTPSARHAMLANRLNRCR